MSKQKEKKPTLSDAERHKRFVTMAKEVGASEKPEDFEAALKTVAAPKGGTNDKS